MKRFLLFALLAAALVVPAALQDGSAQCPNGSAPAYHAAPMYYYQPSYHARPSYLQPASAVVTVNAHDDYFEPKTLNIAPGTTVRWVNRGRHGHTVTSDRELFDSGDLPPGASFSAIFNWPGTYHYFCRYHAKEEGMRGTIVVESGGAKLTPAFGGAQPPAGKPMLAPAPVVDVHSLMNLFNKPLYMHLKKDMAQKPADEKGWASIEDRGLQAAEVANLIKLRNVKPPQDQWLKLAANLQSAGLDLAKAAKAQDWDKTTAAYHGLLQRCNDCHQARAPGKAPMLKP